MSQQKYIEGVLVESSTPNIYELDPHGINVVKGQRCEVFLGGQWVPGYIEHRWERGGYDCFISDKGGHCGLCEAMRVRMPFQ